MAFNAVVANPGRLRILTALAVEERQDFVQLRRSTSLTDGNLSAHARRLESAGFVGIDKQFRGGKPVTSFVLTPAGRSALEAHTRRLLAALTHRRVAGPATSSASTATIEPSVEEREPVAALPEVGDDWVD